MSQAAKIIAALHSCSAILQDHERAMQSLEKKWENEMLQAHARRVAAILEKSLSGSGMAGPQDAAQEGFWLLDIANQLASGLHVRGQDVAYFLRQYPMRAQ